MDTSTSWFSHNNTQEATSFRPMNSGKPERHPAAIPATFKHVCTGRDGKLCLFEDAQGHLTVVRSSRLA